MNQILRIGFVDYRLMVGHASMLFHRFQRRKEAGICEIVGCTAMEAEEGKIWANERGIPCYGSVEEMSEQVDAIVIPAASNPELHRELFANAVKAAVPVFVDKPFAQNAEEGFAIFRMAREKKVPVFSSSSLRFSDEVTSTQREAVPPEYVQAWGGWSRKFDEFIIHPIETAMSVMGASVEAVGRETVGDTHRITLYYPEGRRADVFFSPGEQPYEFSVCNAAGWRHQVIASPFFERLIDHALDFFRGEPPVVTPRETLAVLKAIDAARVSSNGEIVKIRWSAEEEAFCSVRS